MNANLTGQNTASEGNCLKVSIVIWLFIAACFFSEALRTTLGFLASSKFFDYVQFSQEIGRPVTKSLMFAFNFLHSVLTGGLVNEVTFNGFGVNILRYFNSAPVALIIRGSLFILLSLMCVLKVLAQHGKIFHGNIPFQTTLSWITRIACILATPLLVVPGLLSIAGTIIDCKIKKTRSLSE